MKSELKRVYLQIASEKSKSLQYRTHSEALQSVLTSSRQDQSWHDQMTKLSTDVNTHKKEILVLSEQLDE